VLKTDNLPLSCHVVKKSGNPNFLEPSGPVQACNGTALPLHMGKAITLLYSNTADDTVHFLCVTHDRYIAGVSS